MKNLKTIQLKVSRPWIYIDTNHLDGIIGSTSTSTQPFLSKILLKCLSLASGFQDVQNHAAELLPFAAWNGGWCIPVVTKSQ